MRHPMLQDACEAMQDGIVYHDDPLAAVLASRLIVLEARYAGEESLRRAYGWNWEAILGVLRMAETITAEEEEILSSRLSLRQRRLGKIGMDWLKELGRAPVVHDVFEDLHRLTGDDVAERTVCALRNGAIAGLVHLDVGEDTPITHADELELSQPVRAVLIARGVNL